MAIQATAGGLDRVRVRAWRAPHLNPRVATWLRRYAPAEVAGTVTALAAAQLASRLGAGAAATAVAATVGETLGFYTIMFVRELRTVLAALGSPAAGSPATRTARTTVRRLILEFGPAELMDTLVTRPLAMYAGPLLLGSLTAGVMAGKLAADLAFYAAAILGYEFLAGQGTGRNAPA